MRARLGYVMLLGFLAAIMPIMAHAEAALPPASAFVRDLGDTALEKLAKSKADKSIKHKQFRDLLINSFDIPTIGRFVLGPTWRSLDEAQRSEYLDLFEQLIIKVYAGRFDEYNGESFVISNELAETERDTIVNSVIQRPNAANVAVDWRVRLFPDGKRRIIDVVVEGISMSATQRDEFGSILDENGGDINALLDALRKKLGKA